MDISIIIINFNTDELTIQAVESVFKNSSDLDFEVIVVDNNSRETKLAEALSLYPKTYFYQLNSNVGFGNANNYGYSKSSGNYIFLLNSDAYLIDKNTFSTFVDYLKKHSDVACVGGNLMDLNHEPNISYGNFLSVERMLHDFGIKKAANDHYTQQLSTSRICSFTEPTAVPYITAAAVLIKREIIEKYGLFNPQYFMYLEDMDMCYRYKKEGYLSVLIPEISMVHVGGQSGLNNATFSRFVNKKIVYSKYLFLQNVTNWPTAFGLFMLGKTIPIFRRIVRKLKST
ncbi:glycosyltransferase family 2 protein [Flavobacterium sp. PL12]|uniref:glycosyltransferase family 2 protein n=1 Tax=Flavobacterium sp. PL12 TaxID=3071718 RepID=UPI00319E2584